MTSFLWRSAADAVCEADFLKHYCLVSSGFSTVSQHEEKENVLHAIRSLFQVVWIITYQQITRNNWRLKLPVHAGIVFSNYPHEVRMKTFLLIALCLIKQLIMQNICNLSFFCVCLFSFSCQKWKISPCSILQYRQGAVLGLCNIKANWKCHCSSAESNRLNDLQFTSWIHTFLKKNYIILFFN